MFWLSMPTQVLAEHVNELPAAKGKIVLEVYGAIRNTNADEVAQYDWAMLKAFPRVRIETHTSVTDGVHTFDGFLLRDLLEQVGAAGSAVVVTALNYYEIEIPIEEFDDYDVILAYAMDGKRLRYHEKGPLWIVYPRDDHPELQDIRYDYRWVWQVFRLGIL
ncbi:molybdopterin-dependent oxidoreductase [Pusillimonas sp. T7-7]|uniref:molybdopterin-dependent oxidoreductase n=1 Tax=Pusillimonas sp. (strain T7-7) TaxID=1007105 RepID=UPI00192BBB9E|nr:molybdopterin-dependent oxidoreductase [Pusillimonas sp. T7-7]